MLSLPVHDRARSPHARLSDLHPGSRLARLVGAERNRADGQPPRPVVARLELGSWRQVQALGVLLAPRRETGLEARCLASRIRVRLTILRGATLRAALGPTLVGRLESERLSTPVTRLFHASILSLCGLGTVPMMAVRMDRRGRGVELNPGYWLDSVKYLEAEERSQDMPTLFDFGETA